jgi:DNA-binding IclR family transcriptional regulator
MSASASASFSSASVPTASPTASVPTASPTASVPTASPTASGQADPTAPVSYRTSPTLICGLGLLRQFTPDRPERGIAELAEGMRVSPPTAHRYASTCLELGYLAQGRKRRYRLTRRSAEPGMAVLGTLRLSSVGEGILRELREATGRTVALAVLDGTEVLYLQRYRGYHRGEYRLERGWGAGSRRPARGTAAGRALLAALGESEDLGAGAEQPPRAQLPRLPRIHEGGPIVDDGALPGQARGLAVVVDAPGERASAIELTVPAEAMSAVELVAELGEPLLQAGEALRVALGADAEEHVAALRAALGERSCVEERVAG